MFTYLWKLFLGFKNILPGENRNNLVKLAVEECEDSPTTRESNKYNKHGGYFSSSSSVSISAFAAGSVDSIQRNINNHHYYYNPHSIAGESLNVVSGVKNDEDEFYYDDTNDQSWVCSFGTEEGVSVTMPS